MGSLRQRGQDKMAFLGDVDTDRVEWYCDMAGKDRGLG